MQHVFSFGGQGHAGQLCLLPCIPKDCEKGYWADTYTSPWPCSRWKIWSNPAEQVHSWADGLVQTPDPTAWLGLEGPGLDPSLWPSLIHRMIWNRAHMVWINCSVLQWDWRTVCQKGKWGTCSCPASYGRWGQLKTLFIPRQMWRNVLNLPVYWPDRSYSCNPEKLHMQNHEKSSEIFLP